MTFTALHRALGLQPEPISDRLLDEAVAAGVPETDDLDWKSELPPASGLPLTDFPKDVAAMANRGGGLIVYGVKESQGAAVVRVDVGDVSEAHERSLRSVAVTSITPPVFGLKVHRLSSGGMRAIVVQVPPSTDGPHLIYRNDYFGAPVRNGADTVWMKERQIEAMYRSRFDERRHADLRLGDLYDEASVGRDIARNAWFVAVAHPRVPVVARALTREDTRQILREAERVTLSYAGQRGPHPLEAVDRDNPRPGLRRWVARNLYTDDFRASRAAWASMHHDGSVTLAASVGGHRVARDLALEGGQVESLALECAVADFMALVRATAQATNKDEYIVRVGLEWLEKPGMPLQIVVHDDSWGLREDVSIPLRRFTSIEAAVDAAAADPDYHEQVHDLARDCVNQGGLAELRLIASPG